MPITYAKNFLAFNDADVTIGPHGTGAQSVDRYGQVYFYQHDNARELKILDGDTLALVWSSTPTQFRDTYVVPTFAAASSHGVSHIKHHLLKGGEYMLSTLSASPGATTHEYYVLTSTNDGAAPTFVAAYYRDGWRLHVSAAAFLANAETYDDPIVIAYSLTSTRWFFDIIPSVNDLIAGTFSAWTTGTSHVFSAGELPLGKGTLPTVSGHDTAPFIGDMETISRENIYPCHFFKVSETDATNLNIYIDKQTMAYQVANTGGNVNAWVKNIVAPSNDQAIISFPLGNVTPASVGPSGASSEGAFTVADPIVNTTLLPTMPDEGDERLTDAVASTDIRVLPSTNVVTLGNTDYLPVIVTSRDVTDGESAQPGEDLIQYVRVYNYKIDDGVMVLDGTAEGSIFNNDEYGDANPHGPKDFWDILQISAHLTSTNELVFLGFVGGNGNSQEPQSVFLAGFGELSIGGRRRSYLL